VTAEAMSDTHALSINESRIRSAARRNGQGWNIPLIAARQAAVEVWTRASGARFRRADNADACRGYQALSARDLAAVNARQRWANWRTIPRNLDGHCPDRPLRALDLCSGTGDATAVLAWHLPRGSRILGLEYQHTFVAEARRRHFRDAQGTLVETRFSAQSVLERFRDEQGEVLADASMDLVNCSGAVGCHFRAEAAATLAREVARVLRPGGLALIDAGDAGTSPETLERICWKLGLSRLRAARSCWLDRYVQICFRRG
jgi:SAM-dependent methyltransferase